MTAQNLAALLSQELRLDAFSDVSNNGLQIDNRGEITHVAMGVDASLETFEAAIAIGAEFLIVHHGLSWGNSLARITGLNYDLVAYAIDHNLAVYAAHLPLDAHPQWGNNAQLANLFDLQNRVPFLEYHGQKIGIMGNLPTALPRDAFIAQIQSVLKPLRLELFNEGATTIRTLGICSGGAPEGITEAAACQLDAYLCGEANLIAYNLAKQLKVNAYFAGHYTTETLGVQAIGHWLSDQTGLPTQFIRFPIPY